MKNILFLLCALSTLPVYADDKPSATERYVLCGNPACALVDRDGRLLMPRVFEGVVPVAGDLAIFTKAGLHGLIDGNGRTVLEPRYQYMEVTAAGDKVWASESNHVRGTLFNARGEVLQSDVERPREAYIPPPPEVKLLVTSQGTVLADTQGRAVSEPFERISQPDPDAQSMLAIRQHNGVQQTGQLLRTGRFIPTPEEADGLESFREGVAPVRRHDRTARRTHMGLLNVDGGWVLPLELEHVNPARDGLVSFKRDGQWGVADTRGNVRVAPRFARIDRIAHRGRFGVVLPSGQAGVIDGQGRWVVPAEFHAIDWVDSELIAATLRTRDEHGSTDTRLWLFDRQGIRLSTPELRFVLRLQDRPLLLFKGPDGATGLLDLRGRVVAQGVSEELPDTINGPYFVRRGERWGLVDAQGKDLGEHRFFNVKQQFHRGRAVADDKLLDEHGRIIASYASVVPDASWHDTTNPRLEAELDPCFNPDPTEAFVHPEPLAALCADASLRVQLREAQQRHHAALAVTGDPLSLIQLESRFRQRVFKCKEKDCLAEELRARLASIGLQHKQTPFTFISALGKTPSRKVPDRLTNRLLMDFALQADLVEDASWRWRFIDVNNDGHAEVLATQTNGRYMSFTLFGRHKGRWSPMLTGYGDEPQTSHPRRQRHWPDLRRYEQDNFEWGSFTVHRYKAGRYQPLLNCESTFMDAKEERSIPLVFCDTDTPWRAAPVENH